MENTGIEKKQEASPTNKRPKKKHRFLALKIILGILLTLILIVLILLGTLFYFLYDGTDGVSKAKEGRTQTDVENKILFNSFDSTKDDGKIRFSLDKADLDQLLYIAMNSFPNEAKQYIKKSYVEINGDNYKFYLQGNYSIIKTRVGIDTTFKTDMDNRQFIFIINNITLGKINNVYGMVASSLSESLKDEDINKSFEENGLHLKVSLKDKQINYGFDDLANDIVNMIDDENTKKNIAPFIKLLFKENMVGTEGNNNFSLYLDLSKSKFNPKYMVDDTPYLTLDKIPEEVKSLKENNSSLTDGNLSTIFNFLTKGYANLADDEKSFINQADLSSVESFTSKNVNKEDYAGIVPPSTNNNSVEKELQDNFNSAKIDLQNKKLGFTVLKESYLNSLFRSVGIVGSSFVLTGKADDQEKMIYMTLDDISTNIVDNHIYLLVRLNINGFVSTFIYNASFDPNDVNNENFTFKFKEEEITLGSIQTDDEIQDLFFSYFKDSLKNIKNNNWLTLEENRNISFSLKEQIQKAMAAYPEYAPYISNLTATPEVKSDSASIDNPLEGDGQIRLNIGYTN